MYRLKDGDKSHPVEHLHAEAQKKFSVLLSRQSDTFEEAVAEYRRRYGRAPPPDFDKWFAFTKKHDSLIVDDYDEMMRSLEPFWKFRPHDIVTLMKNASFTQIGSDIKECSLRGGKLENCGRWSDILTRCLGAALSDVPEFTFLVNFLDEPVVLSRHSAPAKETDNEFVWSKLSHKPIWPQVEDACTKRGRASTTKEPQSSPHVDFVSNVSSGTDLCAHPEFKHIHGHLASAVSSLHINRTVPILSQAVPDPFQDIMLPSPSYSWDEYGYSKWGDMSWARKKDALYWAGSSTGSYTHDATWRNHHRQRLVLLGMGATAEGKMFTYLGKVGGRNKNEDKKPGHHPLHILVF